MSIRSTDVAISLASLASWQNCTFTSINHIAHLRKNTHLGALRKNDRSTESRPMTTSPKRSNGPSRRKRPKRRVGSTAGGVRDNQVSQTTLLWRRSRDNPVPSGWFLVGCDGSSSSGWEENESSPRGTQAPARKHPCEQSHAGQAPPISQHKRKAAHGDVGSAKGAKQSSGRLSLTFALTRGSAPVNTAV